MESGPYLSPKYIQHIESNEHKTGSEPDILSSLAYKTGCQTKNKRGQIPIYYHPHCLQQKNGQKMWF